MNDNEIKGGIKKESAVLDDIFADDDEPANTNANPVVSKTPEPVNAKQPQTIDYETEGLGFLGVIKKYLLKIIILIFVCLLLGIGFFYRQQLLALAVRYSNIIGAKFTTSFKKEATVNNEDTKKIEGNQSVTGDNAVEQTSNQVVGGGNSSGQPTAEIDSDHDGLTDAEEKSLGTDPNRVDSDGDGLFDREEVKVYKTNPLNPDTDGDGYKDGEEIKAKMNPRGSGTLNEMK